MKLKKLLYESIMKLVSISVKKVLNEAINHDENDIYDEVTDILNNIDKDKFLKTYKGNTYRELVYIIHRMYLDKFTREELSLICEDNYVKELLNSLGGHPLERTFIDYCYATEDELKNPKNYLR